MQILAGFSPFEIVNEFVDVAERGVVESDIGKWVQEDVNSDVSLDFKKCIKEYYRFQEDVLTWCLFELSIDCFL